MTNLAAAPDEPSDLQVFLCPDTVSTGLRGAERANNRPATCSRTSVMGF